MVRSGHWRKDELSDAEGDVEPAYWADIRGEARWDFLTLWTMLVAGVLLIIDSPAWAYFGLVGGGVYLYFAGRGISTRIAMQRGGFRIGSPHSVKLGYAFLTIWGSNGPGHHHRRRRSPPNIVTVSVSP